MRLAHEYVIHVGWSDVPTRLSLDADGDLWIECDNRRDGGEPNRIRVAQGDLAEFAAILADFLREEAKIG